MPVVGILGAGIAEANKQQHGACPLARYPAGL
jgi:hypothetical protein